MDGERKNEGFLGQRAIAIPRKIILRHNSKNLVSIPLHITEIGYYPKAMFHYRDRPAGAEQHILIFCIDGGGEVVMNNAKHTIVAGEFIIIPVKTPHTYKADEKNPWSIYWLHFKGEMSGVIANKMMEKHNNYKGFVLASDKLIELFEDMYSQLERGYSDEHLINSNMCLWHYLALITYDNNKSNGILPIVKDSINLTIDFMNNNLHNTLTTESMASGVNLSVSHFNFIFKKKTGYTPIGYFNHLKIQKACQYLLFTDLRIKEIAFQLGMEDQYYFSRLFNKIMGISPQVYRLKRTQ